jgi:hypothetical protein
MRWAHKDKEGEDNLVEAEPHRMAVAEEVVEAGEVEEEPLGPGPIVLS